MTDDTRRPDPDQPQPAAMESPEPGAGPQAEDTAEWDTIDAVDIEPEEDASDTLTAEPVDAPVRDETAPSGQPEPTPSRGRESVSEPGVDAAVGDQRTDTFVWHPDHAGKTFDEVRRGLAQEIASDQRQHRLAMEGAEESEQDALASVVTLERKWGPYDFDWAEQDPELLADRIAAFERERERRQEMVPWSDYRDAQHDREGAHERGERAAELSTSAKALSLLLVVLLIVVILLAVWAL